MGTKKCTPTLSKAKAEQLGYNQAKAGYKASLKLARELGMKEEDIPNFVQGMKNYINLQEND